MSAFRAHAVRDRVVLLFAAVVAVAALVLSADSVEQLSPGGYEVPGSESHRAAELLASDFGTGLPNLAVVVTPTDGNVDGASARVAALELERTVATHDAVSATDSYWRSGRPELLAIDGRSAMLTATIAGDDEDAVYAAAETLVDDIDATDVGAGIDVLVGGLAAANLDIVREVERDTALGELIALPVTLVLLLLMFRGLAGALLALVTAALAVPPTLLVLETLSHHLQINVFASTIATALGLGVAVDFTLFIFDRYQRERRRHANVDAVAVTMRTAGRAVRFSGLTTAASIACLFAFRLPLLRSLAIAGVASVMFALAAATIVLPALLRRFGHRIPVDRAMPDPGDGRGGRWYRLASLVVAHPVRVAVATTLVLLALAAPFRSVDLGVPDDRVLPADAPARIAGDEIRTAFPAVSAVQLSIVSENRWNESMDAMAAAASELGGVVSVLGPGGVSVDGSTIGPGTDSMTAGTGRGWAIVSTSVTFGSDRAADLVDEVRALDLDDVAVVGGEAARATDVVDTTVSRALVAIALVALAVLTLLAVAFRSALLPIKAFVLNLLSLTAMYGVLVLVFQEGRFSGLLGFEPTGQLDVYTPFIMLAVAFGLSMDYEVFLLSQMKEVWDETHDNDAAIAIGLERSGALISKAAGLMAIVFASFAFGGVTLTKVFGVGLAISIVVDATIVRGLLAPAVMKLAGDRNWRWRSTAAEPSPWTPPDPNGLIVPDDDAAVDEVAVSST